MEGNAGTGTRQESRSLPEPQAIDASLIADHIISFFVRTGDYSQIHSSASAAIMKFGQEEFERGMQYQRYLDDLAKKLETPIDISLTIADALQPPPLPANFVYTKNADTADEPTVTLQAIP